MKEGYFYINNNILPALFAISEVEQSRGLMYQNPPVPNMCFIYKSAQINKFWMANTIAPLDILFCFKGKIKEICKGEPYSTSIIGPDYPTDLIIELPFGTAKSLDIKIGQHVGLISKF